MPETSLLAAREAYLEEIQKARKRGLRLPEPGSHRAEIEGVVFGFIMAWRAFDLVKPLDRTDPDIVEWERELFYNILKAANELYPPYDPLPAPTKRGEDGTRHGRPPMEP